MSVYLTIPLYLLIHIAFMLTSETQVRHIGETQKPCLSGNRLFCNGFLVVASFPVGDAN